MERKLAGRRTSSKLQELIELVMARPLVSAGMVVKMLEVTPQAARRIVGELGLREMTGRERFQAWGVFRVVARLGVAGSDAFYAEDWQVTRPRGYHLGEPIRLRRRTASPPLGYRRCVSSWKPKRRIIEDVSNCFLDRPIPTRRARELAV